MKNLIIVISILLTLLLSGCANKKMTLAKNCECLTDYNGDYYGEKKDGIRHGQGEMIWTDGLIYKGEWQDGEPHGQGRITDTDGSFFDGEYKFGKLDGQGSTIHVSGNKYIGGYKDGKLHGQGTYTTSKGNIVKGEWKDNKMLNGTLSSPDGVKFVGKFKDMKPWNVMVYDKDGKIIGKVVNGEKIKP